MGSGFLAEPRRPTFLIGLCLRGVNGICGVVRVVDLILRKSDLVGSFLLSSQEGPKIYLPKVLLEPFRARKGSRVSSAFLARRE